MTANDIRNIALLGHGGSGKTSLAEQMLFMTKGTDRLGRTADGNTTCDYDAEEIKRQISISLAFAPVNYKGVKINVMDPRQLRLLRRGSVRHPCRRVRRAGGRRQGQSVRGHGALLEDAGQEAPDDLHQPHR